VELRETISANTEKLMGEGRNRQDIKGCSDSLPYLVLVNNISEDLQQRRVSNFPYRFERGVKA
jgi:hypothetical protein